MNFTSSITPTNPHALASLTHLEHASPGFQLASNALGKSFIDEQKQLTEQVRSLSDLAANGETKPVIATLINPFCYSAASAIQAISAAASHGHEVLVDRILHDVRQNRHQLVSNALLQASNSGHAGVVEMVLYHPHAIVSLSTYEHALKAAAAAGHQEVMQVLINYQGVLALQPNVDIDSLNQEALRISIEQGHANTVSCILQELEIDQMLLINPKKILKQAIQLGNTSVLEVILSQPYFSSNTAIATIRQLAIENKSFDLFLKERSENSVNEAKQFARRTVDQLSTDTITGILNDKQLDRKAFPFKTHREQLALMVELVEKTRLN